MNYTAPDAPSQSVSELSFSSLNLLPSLLTNLDSLDYKKMTPIQAKSLPIMLQRQDIIAQAKTGSGKTAAFGLTVLNHLTINHFATQALVLCPTRELAEQVAHALRRLARLLPNVKIINLSGGVAMRPQTDSLRHGAHIVVGTPGRVQKHLDNNALSLKHLKTLVLDEADRMLDMGFFDSIQQIISSCPHQRQTLLFSATYPAQIKQLASEFMQQPERVVIKEEKTELDIEQYFYEVSDQDSKFDVLNTLLRHHQPTSTLIFCNMKDKTTQLTTRLTKAGFSATALNGDMEQNERDLAMIRFANHSCSILVATDVAARGLDIKELPTVINYDLAFEPEVHIHRIGRTGRAGSKGLAISLTTPSDANRLCLIETELGQALAWKKSTDIPQSAQPITQPPMATLCLFAGRKDKIRPGDILGALTKDAGLPGDSIGKINILALSSYIAVNKNHIDKAYHHFKKGQLKGRRIDVKKIR